MRDSQDFASIDWAAPWLQAWRCRGQPIASARMQGGALHTALNGHAPRQDRQEGESSAQVSRFVSHCELPGGEAYEAFIDRSGCCPTRDNLHDFFNGLCWLQFPRAKTQLNQLQAAALAAQAPGAPRGPVRDAITVFDENGALLDAPEPLWQALRERDWVRLFVTLRPLWREARLLLFGHALLEKLVHPRKAVVAHVYAGNIAIASIAKADECLERQLTVECLATKPFLPLPVLGVPGWWPENENFSFYDDSQVFRPARAV